MTDLYTVPLASRRSQKASKCNRLIKRMSFKSEAVIFKESDEKVHFGPFGPFGGLQRILKVLWNASRKGNTYLQCFQIPNGARPKTKWQFTQQNCPHNAGLPVRAGQNRPQEAHSEHFWAQCQKLTRTVNKPRPGPIMKSSNKNGGIERSAGGKEENTQS